MTIQIFDSNGVLTYNGGKILGVVSRETRSIPSGVSTTDWSFNQYNSTTDRFLITATGITLVLTTTMINATTVRVTAEAFTGAATMFVYWLR